jgi:membrane-bound serine protease (ClpP class)
LGKEGHTITELNPNGKIFIDGEYWNAEVQDIQHIAKGEKVKVVKTKGLKLVVKKLEQT